MSGSIEVLPKRSKTKVWNLDRPQKSPVFHNKSKAELKASKMGLIFIAIQLYIETCSRKKHR